MRPTIPAVHSVLSPVAPALPARAPTDRLFFLVFAAVAALKVVLATVIPLTGDEAYFVIWGRFPHYGYYDHGAMAGWWVALTLLVGKSTLILRLPAVITPLIGSLILRRALSSVDPAKANLAAALFLLSPAILLSVFITADTPLVFFSLLAGGFAIRAERSGRLSDWGLAGVCVGLAFLSKYLAVLLGLAFVTYLATFGGRQRFSRIVALAAGAAPGVAVNLIWNFNYGWTNVLFNAYTRNEKARLSLESPLLLATFVFIVLAGPVILYYLVRPSCLGRRPWRETWNALRDSGLLVALFAVAVPAIVFFVVSLVRPVGLHWLFSFYPFFFLVLAAKFDVAALQRQIRPMIIYASAFSALGLVLLALPTETFQWHRSYNSLVLGRHHREIAEQLAPFAANYTLVSPSYAQAAQLSFHTGRHVPVIGPGSPHGRQDDFITDFSALDGRDLMVLSARPKDAAATQVFFERVETREIQVRGARISLVLGRGFKFAAYRDSVLRRVAEEYYRMPAWLESWARPAPFVRRYGLEPATVP